LGAELFFFPIARGFLFTQAPPRRMGLSHRPGGRNATGGRWSG
jgi:hypothetical protein